jgi:hypothetical protein
MRASSWANAPTIDIAASSPRRYVMTGIRLGVAGTARPSADTGSTVQGQSAMPA